MLQLAQPRTGSRLRAALALPAACLVGHCSMSSLSASIKSRCPSTAVQTWLPGTFHELPDSLVTKYMNDYRSGLKARMHFPKVICELDEAVWCGILGGYGSFSPSYENYFPNASKERAQRIRKWFPWLAM